MQLHHSVVLLLRQARSLSPWQGKGGWCTQLRASVSRSSAASWECACWRQARHGHGQCCAGCFVSAGDAGSHLTLVLDLGVRGASQPLLEHSTHPHAGHGSTEVSMRETIIVVQLPEWQLSLNPFCMSLQTDPKCYFIIYRGNKGLFFKSLYYRACIYV